MKLRTAILDCNGVYPPREDSYLLLESIEMKEGERFLDMGTGTGIIGIHAALEGAHSTAADISESALECAERNALRAGVKIHSVKSDLFRSVEGQFDVVAFNPPYLPESGADYGEIKGALEAKEGGSRVADRFLDELPAHLSENGRAYLLISSHTNTDFLEKHRNTLVFKEISRKHLFFEDIFVFMLKVRKDL